MLSYFSPVSYRRVKSRNRAVSRKRGLLTLSKISALLFQFTIETNPQNLRQRDARQTKFAHFSDRWASDETNSCCIPNRGIFFFVTSLHESISEESKIILTGCPSLLVCELPLVDLKLRSISSNNARVTISDELARRY